MAVWDWEAIKTEYITGTMGYRELAISHGVEYSVLAKRAAKEKWTDARKEFAIKKTSKTIEKLSSKEADRAAKIFGVADKLLLKIERMADSDKALNGKDIRALTAAVKDLKEIHGVKTALEREEQQARIDVLRRQAEKDSNGKEPITVVLSEELEEFCG